MRKVFFIIFMALYGLGFLSNLLNGNIIGIVESVIFAVSLWVAFGLINKVIATGQSNDLLTSEEKKKVLITEFFSPIIVGAFYYYSWKKNFPEKAKQANKYSWMIIGVLALIAIVALIFTILLVA